MKFQSFAPGDAAAIEALFLKVFADSDGSSEGEVVAGLVAELMRSTPPCDLYGFTAWDAAELVGALFFSRFWFEANVRAFILAPVAVRTDRQRQGIGQALIRHGLEELKAAGVELLLTYGDPRFYSKVGFQPVFTTVLPAPFVLSQPEGWLAQSLSGHPIQAMPGTSRCVPALNQQHYW